MFVYMKITIVKETTQAEYIKEERGSILITDINIKAEDLNKVGTLNRIMI